MSRPSPGFRPSAHYELLFLPTRRCLSTALLLLSLDGHLPFKMNFHSFSILPALARVSRFFSDKRITRVSWPSFPFHHAFSYYTVQLHVSYHFPSSHFNGIHRLSPVMMSRTYRLLFHSNRPTLCMRHVS